MKELHLKRLERLAKEHEKREKRGEKLDMSKFAYDCKTPACSAGLACFIKEFQRAGLRLSELEIYKGVFAPKFMGRANYENFFGFDRFKRDDFQILKHLFGQTKRTHARQARILDAFVAKQRKAMQQKRSA